MTTTIRDIFTDCQVKNEIIKDFPQLLKMFPVAEEYNGIGESSLNGVHKGHAFEFFVKSVNFNNCYVYEDNYIHLFNEITIISNKLYKDVDGSVFVVVEGTADGQHFISITCVYDGIEEYFEALTYTTEKTYNKENEDVLDLDTFIKVLGDYNNEVFHELYSTLYQ